ncbi:MAG: hypothetical protein QOE70_3196 [Chthoniobacter sp.]|jgi:hypothetical protein|nr:hypothetical protein [Chthoniobacter sp.]
MSRLLIILALILLGTVSLALGPYTLEEMSPIEREAAEAFQKDPRVLLNVPEAKKQQWIAVVRSRWADKDPSGSWWSPYLQGIHDFLFFLGDAQSRKIELDNYAEGNGNHDLFVQSADPRLVEALAPLLFRNEEYTIMWRPDLSAPRGPVEDFVTRLPPSFDATLTIHDILCVSPAFGAEVINWAQQLKDEATKRVGANQAKALRPIFRDWWRENEPFFKQQNFQAVKPGRELVKDERDAEQPHDRTEAFKGSSPAQRSHPSALPSPAARSQSQTPSIRTLWACAALAVAFLTGLLIFWKRRA